MHAIMMLLLKFHSTRKGFQVIPVGLNKYTKVLVSMNEHIKIWCEKKQIKCDQKLNLLKKTLVRQ